MRMRTRMNVPVHTVCVALGLGSCRRRFCSLIRDSGGTGSPRAIPRRDGTCCVAANAANPTPPFAAARRPPVSCATASPVLDPAGSGAINPKKLEDCATAVEMLLNLMEQRITSRDIMTMEVMTLAATARAPLQLMPPPPPARPRLRSP